MLLIVMDSFDASSQNATVEEQMQRANVWTDLLSDTIPENRLQDAFRAAFRKHDSTFPVNAYELQAAWKEIDVEEKKQRYQALEKDQRENPVKYCDAAWNHLNPEGDVEIYMGVPPNGREVIVPCNRCRPGAFYTRYDEERSKFVADLPHMKETMEKDIATVMLEMLAQAKAKLRERPEPKSAIGILTKAMLNGGDKEKIVRIKDYLRRTRETEPSM